MKRSLTVPRTLALLSAMTLLFAMACTPAPPTASPSPSPSAAPTQAVVPTAAPGETPATDVTAVLDGLAPVQADALSQLAFERATLGANWLRGALRDDGSFYYQYDPDDDEYEEENYNEVRHAGTTYSMFYAAGATGDQGILEAAQRAVVYIESNSIPMGNGRGFVYEGNVKLGGQALALVALLEGRRVMGDSRYDPLINDLATFLLELEIPQEPGRFYNRVTAGQFQTEPVSRFYPGEALLALTRLAAHFPDGPYLDAAKRAANWLLKVRDGDVTVMTEPPEVDHWLAMALSDLHRLAPEDDYVTGVSLHADTIIKNMWRAEDGVPARIGGVRRTSISYTSTATRGEAMMAAWALARRIGDEDRIQRWSEAAQRIAQFQMRVQYVGDDLGLYPEPSRVVGGWPGSVGNRNIRIDYVQHQISSLLGAWYLLRGEDLPHAQPG